MGSDPQEALQAQHNADKEKIIKELRADQSRTCANCACSIMQKNTMGGDRLEQLFCRRDPVNAARARFERPVMRNGQASIDKKSGKPIMEFYEDVAFMYRPVMPDGVCFDGWRPVGTLPGDKFQNATIDGYMEKVLDGFNRLGADLQADALAQAVIDDDKETH